MEILIGYLIEFHWENNVKLYWNLQMEIYLSPIKDLKYGNFDGGVDGEVNM